MIVNIKGKEVNVAYLQVDAGVRYWEDTEINGEDDIDFYESKGVGTPMIPCAVKVKEKPTTCIYSDHYRWQPLIDVSTGKILNWKQGIIADVHYKICDDGVYSLLDKDKNEIIKVESYVPELLDPYIDGYGDYIIFEIGSDGYIRDWEFNQDLVDKLIKGDFNCQKD